MNPFINFCNTNRRSVRDENPELSMVEIAKLLGAQWRALTVEDKEKYYY